MTVQRRPRRHPSPPDQQDRLRALALDTSPTARRLRDRIPRPPVDIAGQPSSGDPPIPSAPYAAGGTDTPYHPPAPRRAAPASHSHSRHPSAPAWPEREPADTVAAPAPALADATAPGQGPRRESPALVGGTTDGSGPWRTPGIRENKADPKLERGLPSTGQENPDTAGAGEEGGRHRRPERPPSGYEEFDPEPPGPLLERLARRWGTNATLSRRAVLTLLVLGLLAVVTAVLVLRDRPETVTATETVAQTAPVEETGGEETGGGEEPAAPDAELVVHVGGEVEDPGLYTIPPGSRVADAVEEAGGALPEADLDTLNLARPLVDGEQILVGVPGTGGVPGTDPRLSGAPVNINQADVRALRTVPQVGEVIAENIVAYREENGPFTSVEDLVNVDRIGDQTLETIKPHVTVG